MKWSRHKEAHRCEDTRNQTQVEPIGEEQRPEGKEQSEETQETTETEVQEPTEENKTGSRPGFCLDLIWVRCVNLVVSV